MAASIRRLACLNFTNSYGANSAFMVVNSNNFIQTRDKHYHPEFRRQRREKFTKVDLPAFAETFRLVNQELTPAEVRAFMKQHGVIPYRRDAPIVSLADSGEIFDAYKPKEQDGVSSSITDVGKSVSHKGFSWKAGRDIKKLDEEFDINAFPELAQEIYENMHTLLTKVFPRNFLSQYRDDEDYYKLHDVVTEHGWMLVTNGLENKTLMWKLMESLEAPRIVNVVCKETKLPGNKYAQITVRFHNKQLMALYDRFGRLTYGSDSVPKDVLDFIIFEKHLTDSYGKWRVHGKITTDHELRSQTFKRTLVVPDNFDSLCTDSSTKV